VERGGDGRTFRGGRKSPAKDAAGSRAAAAAAAAWPRGCGKRPNRACRLK